MALELYMIGLIVADMGKALDFYRHLGLAIPTGSEKKTHVEIKMGSGLTLFLDAEPSRWDPAFEQPRPRDGANGYHAVLEFYLETQEAVEAKYAELVSLGYQGYRAPYLTSFGMSFAMILDPDGNTILLSGAREQQV